MVHVNLRLQLLIVQNHIQNMLNGVKDVKLDIIGSPRNVINVLVNVLNVKVGILG